MAENALRFLGHLLLKKRMIWVSATVILSVILFLLVVVLLIWAQHSDDKDNCPTCDAWRREWEENRDDRDDD